MDLIRNILYTLTYPVWYVLALVLGNKDRPAAIEEPKKEAKVDSDPIQLIKEGLDTAKEVLAAELKAKTVSSPVSRDNSHSKLGMQYGTVDCAEIS